MSLNKNLLIPTKISLNLYRIYFLGGMLFPFALAAFRRGSVAAVDSPRLPRTRHSGDQERAAPPAAGETFRPDDRPERSSPAQRTSGRDPG
jgi:hypothetical protein